MRRVGEVVRTAQGLAIVRVPEPADEGASGAQTGSGSGRESGGATGESDSPRIGTAVVDENLDDVGRVVDVFGPVDRPYLAVSPAAGVVEARLLGAKLYAR